MLRRLVLLALLGLTLLGWPAPFAMAQDKIKVGVILPMTGPLNSLGKWVSRGINLFLLENGRHFGGKEIEIVLGDDKGQPELTRTIAQEMVDKHQVSFLAGFGLTPTALAAAPIATQSRVPAIVMIAATSALMDASPFFVRSSFTLPQVAEPMADWALKNNIKHVVTIVPDMAVGIDAEKSFSAKFKAGGGSIESIRVSLHEPDFTPGLQRALEMKADGLFVFEPAGTSAHFMKQFVHSGLAKVRLKLIGPGDMVDDDHIESIGDVVVGAITTSHYAMSHPSVANQNFIAAFKKAHPHDRPNFMVVSGYDGMRLIAEALRTTNGKGDGATWLAAMKGMAFESPRGPIQIDPATRDIIQNVYVRRTERKDGALHNVEFDVYPMVKDPGKGK